MKNLLTAAHRSKVPCWQCSHTNASKLPKNNKTNDNLRENKCQYCRYFNLIRFLIEYLGNNEEKCRRKNKFIIMSLENLHVEKLKVKTENSFSNMDFSFKYVFL